jgi:hypothetical protein
MPYLILSEGSSSCRCPSNTVDIDIISEDRRDQIVTRLYQVPKYLCRSDVVFVLMNSTLDCIYEEPFCEQEKRL